MMALLIKSHRAEKSCSVTSSARWWFLLTCGIVGVRAAEDVDHPAEILQGRQRQLKAAGQTGRLDADHEASSGSVIRVMSGSAA